MTEEGPHHRRCIFTTVADASGSEKLTVADASGSESSVFVPWLIMLLLIFVKFRVNPWQILLLILLLPSVATLQQP